MNDPTLHAALDAFVTGPADPAAADAAATAAADALPDAIAALKAAGRRDHLELMGRPAFPKAVKKAAKKAAYQLKSAGVAASAPARPAGISLTAGAGLDDIVLVSAPGLAGRYWVLLAELPDALPVGVETAAWGGQARTTVLEKMSAGRLRQYRRDVQDEELPGKPIIASADLGLAMVGHIGDALRADSGAFPPGWSEVLFWCERARGRGADAARADAATLLADEPISDALAERTAELVDVMAIGPVVPDQAAIDALITQVIETTERDDELTRDELVDRLQGLADAGCDAYYGNAQAQARAARSLRASADVLLFGGDRDRARQCLWIAEQLDSGAVLPHEIGLLSGSFRRVIDYEHAWDHHQAHHAARAEGPAEG
ncbi:MAG: hypothetical protein EP329_15215 [Deltaproteobacteria bacterium]|nr:MAG: hypothetical protein EP329_15215 [Deltaproteobacteria bacterium]